MNVIRKQIIHIRIDTSGLIFVTGNASIVILGHAPGSNWLRYVDEHPMLEPYVETILSPMNQFANLD